MVSEPTWEMEAGQSPATWVLTKPQCLPYIPTVWESLPRIPKDQGTIIPGGVGLERLKARSDL